MEQMRERVARAICKAGAIDPDELNDDTGRPMWRYFVPEADAVQPEIDRRVAEEKARLLERLRDDLNMAIDLIQEAKGWEGPRGGPVTDHLDAAEMWIDGALAQFEKEQQP